MTQLPDPTSDAVLHLHEEVAEHLDEIRKLFKKDEPYKLSFYGRNVEHPDGSRDVLVTEDDVDGLINAIRNLVENMP